VRRGPAEIGEHSREVLGEAGFGADEVEALLADGAIVQGSGE
jgi:crotonobetainyl-CoA:carnitine CoA-transferase CaiB-like acyl-CoA transferase